MILGKKKGGSNRPQLQKQKGLAPSSVLLHPETKVSIMDGIGKTLNLDEHSHREEVGIIHVWNIVEPTHVNVVMARHVVSNMVKRVTS